MDCILLLSVCTSLCRFRILSFCSYIYSYSHTRLHRKNCTNGVWRRQPKCQIPLPIYIFLQGLYCKFVISDTNVSWIIFYFSTQKNVNVNPLARFLPFHAFWSNDVLFCVPKSQDSLVFEMVNFPAWTWIQFGWGTSNLKFKIFFFIL